MAEPRHLHNAPIIEAIIDFRVRPSSDLRVEDLSAATTLFPERYPDFEEQRVITNTFLLAPPEHAHEHSVARRQALRGYTLVSGDKASQAQFRQDGFTFNRLKPYTSWEQVFAEASELWGEYVRLANPQGITRLAVRYINHIEIPLPINDFSEYLVNPPIIPDGVPQELSEFLTRVVVHDAELNIGAYITQALETEVSSDAITLIFDIDAFKDSEMDVTSEDIVAVFADLRQLKNTIFFRSLTEKTVSRYV